MKTLFSISLLLALLLGGCKGVLLPITTGSAEFNEEGKPRSVSYESTKAQAGFSATLNPVTGEVNVTTDNADSPRGYENYVEAQMQVELERIKLYQSMFDAAMKAAAQGAPGP